MDAIILADIFSKTETIYDNTCVNSNISESDQSERSAPEFVGNMNQQHIPRLTDLFSKWNIDLDLLRPVMPISHEHDHCYHHVPQSHMSTNIQRLQIVLNICWLVSLVHKNESCVYQKEYPISISLAMFQPLYQYCKGKVGSIYSILSNDENTFSSSILDQTHRSRHGRIT
jgi:hypothetical protein